MDAKDGFNDMIDVVMREAFVLTFANTVTPFTATRSGKKWTAVHKDKDLWEREGGAEGCVELFR